MIDYAVKQGWISAWQGWLIWLVCMALIVSALWGGRLMYEKQVNDINSCLEYIQSPDLGVMLKANVSIDDARAFNENKPLNTTKAYMAVNG